MGESSGIQWTHHTFNPWRGCTHVSPGCTNCYAEQLTAPVLLRHSHGGDPDEWPEDLRVREFPTPAVPA